MKQTFVQTNKEPLPGSTCDRCSQPLTPPWYFNYRPRAKVKCLCVPCHDAQVEKAFKAIQGIPDAPAREVNCR